MKRIRKTQATLNLPTLKLEGGLFLPDQLEKAAQGRASAQSEADYGTPKGVKLKDEYSRAFQIACAQWPHFAAQLERTDVDTGYLLPSARLPPSDLPGLGIHPTMKLRWLASEHRHYLQWHRERFLLGT